MLSLTLHSLLINTSIVLYNSYFITVFSLHSPLSFLDWEQILFLSSSIILYLFAFCGVVFFLDWGNSWMCLNISRLHPEPSLSGLQAHTSTAFRTLNDRILNEETTHTNIHPFYSRTFLLEHHLISIAVSRRKKATSYISIRRKRNNLFMTIDRCQSIIDHQIMGESVDVPYIHSKLHAASIIK